MLQSIATLIFAAAALAALALTVGLLADDWENVLRSLGFGRRSEDAPLPPRVRMVGRRRVPVLRVIPAELKRAA